MKELMNNTKIHIRFSHNDIIDDEKYSLSLRVYSCDSRFRLKKEDRYNSLIRLFGRTAQLFEASIVRRRVRSLEDYYRSIDYRESV